jgi:hypothetical protein
MTLSYIQIDYDIVDKVQALFDKYGINFNYRKNIIDKLNKYAETNRGLCDALNNYDCIANGSKIYAITLNECKKWKRKLKSVGLHFSNEDDTLIFFRDGMVNSINHIIPLKDSLDNSCGLTTLLVHKAVDCTYNDNNVDSLEELEENLERIDKEVNEYVKFFKSKTYANYLNMLKQSLDKLESEQKIYESSLHKITKGLVKLLDIENEK